jgi:Domain of unknown function (DUF4136)
MKILLVMLWMAVGFTSYGQTINVEYDKTHDFSHYKTFRFGESQIITPDDQKKIPDKLLDKWIITAIDEELQLKGLKRNDSTADLTITYAAGTLARSDIEKIGPVALTPGQDANRSFMYEYRQTSLIIDLNDRSNNLVWRINSTTNMTSAEGEQLVDAIVEKGFKKFGKAPKRKKKK